jgi:DHA1 family tetracycline resistance protein-like MFS transporter
LQALISAGVDEDLQGRLQGVLASLASLASIVGPFAISTIYFATRQTIPGLVWLLGAALYLLCVPVMISRNGFGSPARRRA